MKKLWFGLIDWTDDRFPLTSLWNEHLAKYYAPKNFNFWYYFGSLAMLALVIQLLTGIWLAMMYKPSAAEAFASIEYIMRDVEFGWLIRYMHSTGASFFFVVVYLHMFRGVMYGSYKGKRELIWTLGMLIYLILMAEAFMGYLLPWGQMSFWGAQVIISLFGAIPFGIGDVLSEWIRGDYVVSDATLNRFFALHVVALPLALIGVIAMHILALHEVGSNNPDGVEIKSNKDADGIPRDGVPFHPYYTVKDLKGAVVFLFLFAIVVFFAPEFGGWFLEKDNFIPANTLQTPQHIVPLWYFTPFYAILRAIPEKLPGIITMGLAIGMLFLLPWLDRNPVKSIRYRSLLFKMAVMTFAATFIALGFLGTVVPSAFYNELGFRCAQLYFAFFLLMWVYTRDRRPSFYFAVFVASLIVMALLDWGLPRTGGLMVPGFVWTSVYFAVFLLAPIFTGWGESRPVPERVIFK
jgi:ubiquinol-cytochrome c reductase cytochrome b subunit